MEIVLLGTGAADGWPNPFCACASCAAARSVGEVRGQTAALVDGTLLLDCGPEAPRAAERAGRPLTGVRSMLLTHAHPDHTGPAALLWRGWAGPAEPLDVVGPPSALAACRDWVGAGGAVRFRPVQAGAVLHVAGGHAVRVLAAAHDGDAVLYDVTGPDGTRLLYATDTGPLPEPALRAASGAAYDVVLLEETFGEVTDHGTGHLDLATFPATLAALRRCGAVTQATDVVAVHLGHRNPPPRELGRRLAAWGARMVPDGTVLGGRVPAAAPPGRTLVLGGARSGKSAEAERRLAAEPTVTYVATGAPAGTDPEWEARVARHQARRPASWRTVETLDVPGVLRAAGPGEPVLVDCLTLWLSRTLDAHDAWGGTPDDAAVEAAMDDLLLAWRDTKARAVLVSNEIGGGVVPESASGRLFRDLMGRLNARVAAVSDTVLLMVAGQALPLREAGA